MDHALARRNEEQPRFGLVRGGIHASRDRERLQYFSAVGVEHHEHLRIASSAEQSMVRNVHGQSCRRSGGSQRPARFDLQRAGINGDKFALVF